MTIPMSSLLMMLGAIAALNLFALSVLLRRVRAAVLQDDIPGFLRAAPIAPLALVTELLITGLVAGMGLAAAGAFVPAFLCLGLTALLYCAFGGLRAHLLLSALAGLTRGHGSATTALRFFDALRAYWRPRWLLLAGASALVVSLADLVAVSALLLSLRAFDPILVVALTTAVRLVGSLLLLPAVVGAGAEAVLPLGAEREPVPQHNDLAA
jgi:hypothetical protein